ncbi:MAG: AraC family transcriptional regulator [Clostridia bacterium]|nr:AraC family transcriptional regulator [Clostridia bacterium]
MIQQYGPLLINDKPIVEHLFSVHYLQNANQLEFNDDTHSFWELIYVEDGELTLCVGNQQNRLTKGDIYIISPSIAHNIKKSRRNAYAAILSFSSDEPLLYGISGKTLTETEDTRELLGKIIVEIKSLFQPKSDDPKETQTRPVENPPFGSERKIVGHTEALVINLLNQYNDTSQIPGFRGTRDEDFLFLRMCRFIEQWYAMKLTIEYISGCFSVSPSTLKQLFAKKMGMGPIEYCIQCRIEQAKYLLRKGGLRISEVAFSTGFSSVYYFSRMFKQKTGMSPTEFLEQVRAEQKEDCP